MSNMESAILVRPSWPMWLSRFSQASCTAEASAKEILRPSSEATSSSIRTGTSFCASAMNVKHSARPAPPPLRSRSISRNGPLLKRPTRVLSVRRKGTMAGRMRTPVISMVLVAVSVMKPLSGRPNSRAAGWRD